MENKFNDNELDRWLLENSEPQQAGSAPDGWDTPSEAVWTGLRAGLNARKKRRRGFLWLWFALLFGLLGGSLGYWQLTKNDAAPSTQFNAPQQSENQYSTTKPTLEKTSKPDESTAQPTAGKTRQAQIETTVKNSITTTGNPSQTLPVEIQTNKQTNTATTTPQLPAISETNASINLPEKPGKNTLLPDSKPEEKPASELPEVHASASKKTTFAHPAPASLPLLPQIVQQLPAQHKLLLQRQSLAPKQPNLDKQHKANWYIGVVSGLIFTSRNLKSSSGKLPNGTESGAWTWQQGLQLGLQFNQHWALETGLQRTGIRLTAERQINFQYQADKEQFNHADYLYQNSTDQFIQTAFGEVQMRMDMGREPSRPIQNDANIQITLRTDEQVHYLRMPVLLRYHTGTGPWQWRITTGLGFNFEAGYDLKMTAARSNRPGVRDISARAQNRAQGLSPIMLDAQISAGLQYRLGQHWAVHFAPEFRYGLSSMNRNPNFKSLAISTGIQFGLIYNFR